MLTRKLFRTAWQYKSQFISMIIMICLGIGVFLGFNIEWKSIDASTSEFFEQTNYADFRIYSENGFTEDDIKELQGIDGVDAATRYLSVNVGIKDTEKTLTLNVSENYEVSTMFVTSGAQYDENGDGIWLSDRFAEENDIEVGDSLSFVYQGIQVDGEVLGLVKSSENMICVADSGQLMPDFETHGFAYISPKKLEKSLGFVFYPQVNIISDLDKSELEEDVKDALGKTLQITDKELHNAYAGAQSEIEEGETMAAVLPVLFLLIAVLTMITTMHRIAANEKVQIGTLKALGFKDSRIIRHYTSYGLFIGIVGCAVGIALGYAVAAIMIYSGMLSTYFDLPEWSLTMPAFCVPVIALTVVLLTFISFLSVKKMLVGTAADALRPYAPKAMRKSKIEKLGFWNKLSFSTKWNFRDILRHKTRSAMTLVGVFGCMLLIVGGLGMKDTMNDFLKIIGEDVSNYTTKVTLSETSQNDEALSLCDELDGSWQASSGISYNGDTLSLDIYSNGNDKIRFLTEDNKRFELGDDGIYLCLRLKDTAKIGDTVEFSPYGSETTYKVKVAGYYRSVVDKSIVMTEEYAEEIGFDYSIGTIYTDLKSDEISDSPLISGKQDKDNVMESYDTFMELMNLMVALLIGVAIVLGIVVLYNLGIMSYVERRRELATLKVLGFRDKTIGRLLISQNMWITVLGIILGLPGGAAVLNILITALASEYELSITLGPITYSVSIILTFAVSMIVGLMVAAKNKKIDMVEALKCSE